MNTEIKTVISAEEQPDTNPRKRNQYWPLKLKLLLRVIKQRKISLRKIFNTCWCTVAYWFKWINAAPAPYILSLEPWNECNIKCLFCRDAKGVIHDINPAGVGIEKGRMQKEVAMDIIRQLKDDILIAVLYTNGEPLMYKDLGEVIKFATSNGVATLISSNGILFTEEKAHELLGAGLDCIKIQTSGFTDEIYSIQTRSHDVEKLKSNITMLSKINEQYNALIMIDYILYNYNRHELPLMRQYCEDLGLMINIRPGNPAGGLEETESTLNTETLPLKMKCDYLWKVMQVNFNGDILPCCEAVVWGKSTPYAQFKIGETDVKKIWRSEPTIKFRKTMRDEGRSAYDICSQCTRKGVCFKW